MTQDTHPDAGHEMSKPEAPDVLVPLKALQWINGLLSDLDADDSKVITQDMIDNRRGGMAYSLHRAEKTALRKSPPAQDADVVETACGAFGRYLSVKGWGDAPIGEIDDEDIEAAMRAALSAPPQPQGEAVAWRYRPKTDTHWRHDAVYPEWAEGDNRWEVEPLYAHPATPSVDRLVEARKALEAIELMATNHSGWADQKDIWPGLNAIHAHAQAGLAALSASLQQPDSMVPSYLSEKVAQEVADNCGPIGCCNLSREDVEMVWEACITALQQPEEGEQP